GSADNDASFAVARYAADGSGLDPTFGQGGKVATNVGPFKERATAVLVQPDGKILAAGFVDMNAAATDEDFALVRYNANGNLDGNFGSGGIVTFDFKALTGFTLERDVAAAVALLADGSIVVGGSSSNGNLPANSAPRHFALAKLTPRGVLDGSFGTGGEVLT